MQQASRLGVAVLGLMAACSGPETPQDRMREQYAPTQAVTVGSLSFDVFMALEPEVVYGAGANRLVQIDRASGDVVEVFADYQRSQVARITADDAHVYAVLQHGGGPVDVVRIPQGGGAPELLHTTATTSFWDLATHDGALYALVDEDLGETTERRIIEIPIGGAAPRVLTAALPAIAVTGFVTATDGIYVGLVAAAGEVWRVPYAGGAPVRVQQWADQQAFHLAADATGVYWNAGASAIGAATLYFLPDGGAQPEVLATDVTRGDFAVNDLGFYWVDFEAEAIRAVAREDLGGGAFDLIGTGGPPMSLVADDRAIVFSTNHGELGDLRLHVVPRAQ